MLNEVELQRMHEFCADHRIDSKELAILLHMTGCNKSGIEHRNHYAADPGEARKSRAMKSLVERFLVERFETDDKKHTYFRATNRGGVIAKTALSLGIQSNKGSRLDND